jgi:molecular chaperone DnaK (HSP70)
MLFGDPADRRGSVQPLGLAREFKRRLGDPIPLMLSGSPYHADRLTALMAQWVVETATAQFGETPTRIVLTHPANWTDYQLGTLRNALADVRLGEAELISEPTAAAIDFAAVAAVDPGATILVYDLGGGTFDAVVLKRVGDGFEQEGQPAGIERLGGIDFDEAVFQFVRAAVPDAALEESRKSMEGAAAIGQLRRRCVEAKEALSSQAATDIPVLLPGYTTTIRLTRPEFEEMIRPMVRQTIDLVRRVLGGAQADADSLAAVLLVGGSPRVPLVPQMVTEELGLPVRIDARPKLVVARGAARRAGVGAPPRSVTPAAAGVARDDDGGGGRGWLLKVAALVLYTQDGNRLIGPHGALIGRIGKGPPFVIGAAATITASAAGEPQLGVNDAGLENNGGSFDVTVTVTS